MARRAGKGGGHGETAAAAGGKRRRKRRVLLKLALASCAVVLLTLLALGGLAPWIASRVAPGMIERAAAAQILGSIRVDAISVTWRGPVTIGPLHLSDERGDPVGWASLELPFGVWDAVAGRWWRRDTIDAGTIRLAGHLDAVRRADGTVNIERALALRAPTGEPPPDLPFKSISARLMLDSVTVSYRDESPDVPPGAKEGVGIASLSGAIDAVWSGMDFTRDYPGELSVSGELAGRPYLGAPERAGDEQLRLVLDADANFVPLRPVFTLTAALTGVPVRLLDAIAGTGEQFAGAAGQTASLSMHAQAEGTTDGTISVELEAPHASGSAHLVLADGSVRAQQPARLALDSIAFLLETPEALRALREAGVEIAEAPAVELVVRSASMRAPDMDPDLTDGAIDAVLRIGALEGTISIARLAADDPEARPRHFRVEPTEFRLNTPRLADGVRLDAQTGATIDGESAGELVAGLVLAGLLDEHGRLRAAAPSAMNGSVELRGVSSRLLQPFVSGLGAPLNLSRDAGPTIDLTLTAHARPGDTGAGQIPATDIDARLSSHNIDAAATLRLADDEITSRGDGAALTMRAATPLAEDLLGRAGIDFASLDAVADLRLAAPRFRFPITGDVLGGAEGEAVLTVGAARLAAPELFDDALSAESMRIHLTLDTPAVGAADISADLSHTAIPFTASGRIGFDAAGLLAAAPGEYTGLAAAASLLSRARPSGRINIDGVPVTALSRMRRGLDAAAAEDELTREILMLADTMLGVALDAQLVIEPGQNDETNATLSLAAANATLDADAALRTDSLRITGSTLSATFRPEHTLRLLPVLLEGTPAERARLDQQVTLSARTTPIHLPITDGLPDPSALDPVTIEADLQEPLVLRGVRIAEHPETLGLRDAAARIDLRAAEWLAPGDRQGIPLAATLTGRMLRAGEDIGGAKFELDTSSDPLVLSAEFTQVRVSAVDSIADLDGYAAAFAGRRADLRVSATRTRDGRISTTIDVDGERLTASDVRLGLDHDRIALTAPATLAWRPDPAWVNSRLLGAVIDAEGPVTLEAVAPVTLRLERLTVARAGDADEPVGPMLPGVFTLETTLSSDSAVLRRRDARPLTFEGISLTLSSGQVPGRVSFRTAIQRVLRGDEATTRRSTAAGHISNLADRRGVPTPGGAALTVDADIAAFPTAVLDDLAGRDGLLTELLGPTVTLRAKTNELSKTSGTLESTAVSERASAGVQGRVENGAFVATAPMTFEITEIRPRLVGMLNNSLPLIASLEKRPEDEPGTVTAENVVVPLDGDPRRLNGVVTVDPGTAYFETRDAFSRFLRVAGQRRAGVVGRRIDSFTVTMRNGELTYDRFRLPVGEFTIETDGTVNLVDRTINIVTYVPFFALTDEAAGTLNIGLAAALGRVLPGAIERTTLVPITTRGPLDNPRVSIDVDRFIKEVGQNLLRMPGRLIDEEIVDRLKRLFGGGD